MPTDVDVLIIGAGPAGSSAAALLQPQGFRLLVVEKQIFPRFVIGESLLPHCMDLLQEAGLLEAVEAQGFIHKCGAVFLRGNETCNFDFADQFTAGWKYTFQVPRADFDKTLADTVAARGVEILYGHGVTAVEFNPAFRVPPSGGTMPSREPLTPALSPSDGEREIASPVRTDSVFGEVVRGPSGDSLSPSDGERVRVRGTSNYTVTAEGGDPNATVTLVQPDGSKRKVTAKFILDCSGYGRVLPRLLDLEKPTSFPTREALFTHVTGDQRPAGREGGKIWACIHPAGAWVWIIPFSNGKTSVGVVATPEFFARYPGEPDAQLRTILMADPNVATRLGNMQFAMPSQRISGYACAIKQLYGPHFALAGNATEFLDPIFSSGVTLALASANRAAKVLTRHLRGEAVDWQADYADHVMQGINTFRAYVSAWYDGTLHDIFFAAQANPGIMRQICSVLAGYVWDKSNPYVAQPERALPLLSQIVKAKNKTAA